MQIRWWITTFEEMFRIATRIYGGDPISAPVLLQWSKTSSTEELFQRVQATSEAFKRYLVLSGRPREEILSTLASAGFSAAEAESTLPAVQSAEGYFHRGPRQRTASITNIGQELLIALRHVAVSPGAAPRCRRARTATSCTSTAGTRRSGAPCTRGRLRGTDEVCCMRTTTIRLASLVLVLCAACTAQADRPSGKTAQARPAHAKPATTSTPTVTPEARARALLERQLKALPEDNAPLLATFVPDAVVVLPRVAAKLGPDVELGAQIAGMNPHAQLQSAKVAKLVAGGNSAMVWLAAELEIVVRSQEPGEPSSTASHTVRAVELLDAASGWKVVAASFTEVRPLEQLRQSLGPIPSPTAPGPLAKLLASPDALAAVLASDQVVVFGTDAAERAVGQPAAKALLANWRKLPLAIEEADKVREVRTASWGYAMADVNINVPKPGAAPYRMSAFVIAVPASDGAWSVVAVSYGAL